MENILENNRFHLVGIQGVGMAALAHILMDMGKKVTGSDVSEVFSTSDLLTARSVKLYTSFDEKNIGDAQVVIYTGAHGGRDNVEVVAAKAKKILVFPLAEFIGMLTATKKTIAIAGCHGKTTTSSLMVIALQSLGLHPSWYVGASSFGKNTGGHWDPRGELFVVEADEYVVDPQYDKRAKFLLMKPSFVLISSFDFDHPDVYASRLELEETYKEFVTKLSPDAILIVNGNDYFLCKLAQHAKCRVVIVTDTQQLNGISLDLSGSHNRINASLVISALHQMGQRTIQNDIFRHFTGAKRRLEKVFQKNRHLLYVDYAHHPTEIRATIQSIRELYPNYLICVLFQPHTYSRTAAFVKDFAFALDIADEAFVLPIFSSKREKQSDFSVTSEDISRLSSRIVTEHDANVSSWLKNVLKSNECCVVVTMGAGNVNTMHGELITLFEKYG